jgi:hypothetical protein
LIGDEAAFAQRGDKQWVYMTLAEAYQAGDLAQNESLATESFQRV